MALLVNQILNYDSEIFKTKSQKDLIIFVKKKELYN